MTATDNRFCRTKARNWQRGEARHNAVLTAASVREIRRRKGEKQAALAAEFKTTPRNIAHIHHRRTWNWVE
jgi:transcriptional regulator